MPVRINQPRFVRDRESIVQRLANELTSKSETPFGQPVIIVDETPSTKSARVTVIWEEWSKVPREVRGDIITEAYRRARESQTGFQVTMALGLVPEEAIEIGLLPFEILPSRRDNEGISLTDYQRTIEELGPTFMFHGGPRLRFVTMEDAEAAYRELTERLPGSHWMILRDVSHGVLED